MNNVKKVKGPVKIEKVFISVSYKEGIEMLVKKLLKINPKVVFYSSIGTYKKIFEILGKKLADINLVKIPNAELVEQKADSFDLVVVNLNPFAYIIAKIECTLEMACDNIDIVGHMMLRAAAINFYRGAILCNTDDYLPFCNEVSLNKGCISLHARLELMKKVFDHTILYDSVIREYFAKVDEDELLKLYKCF
ncbi:MAG: hypothetical protein QM490_06365 [Candidatus Gracilibacteria bacterium]